MRHRIPLSDREIAGKLLMRLARHPAGQHRTRFCLSWFYEDDADFLLALAKDLELPDAFPGGPYVRRLQRICRHLESWGVLYGRLSTCHAEYLGEPRMLKSYGFAKEEYAWRLAPDLHSHYTPMGLVSTELAFILRRAYPEPD
jgi:hypothetical protein